MFAMPNMTHHTMICTHCTPATKWQNSKWCHWPKEHLTISFFDSSLPISPTQWPRYTSIHTVYISWIYGKVPGLWSSNRICWTPWWIKLMQIHSSSVQSSICLVVWGLKLLLSRYTVNPLQQWIAAEPQLRNSALRDLLLPFANSHFCCNLTS